MYLFQGYDTTGQAVCFCVLLLAMHQDIQVGIFHPVLLIIIIIIMNSSWISILNCSVLPSSALDSSPSCKCVAYTMPILKYVSHIVMNVHIQIMVLNGRVYPNHGAYKPHLQIRYLIQLRFNKHIKGHV